MEIEHSPTTRLGKLLREASRARPRSLGFSRGRDETKPVPAMLLVAEVDGLDPRAAKAAVESGASAVVFVATSADVSADQLAAAVAACGEAVAGLAFGPGVRVPVELDGAIGRAGIDFVVASASEAPASLLDVDGVGAVVRIEGNLTAGLLRALGELGPEAVFVTPPSDDRRDDLSVFDLMHYKQVVDLVRPSVLVAGDAGVRPGNLQALRDAGVEGVVLPPSIVAGGLTAYRDALAKVTIKRRKERSGDGHALIPRLTTSTGPSESDDDEE